jgi:hypothetical protein
MAAATNVISIAEFRDRKTAESQAEMLVLAETASRRVELAALLVRAGIAGGRIDWADTVDNAERRVAEIRYDVHLFDLGTDPAPAAPLVEALLALPEQRTVIVCRLSDAEMDDLRERFPSAAVIAETDLTAEWLRGDAEPMPPVTPLESAGLDGLIETARSLRASVAGINRQMAIADAELDAGKALDGQIHLVAAMQRLNDVEERLGALESDLRDRLDQATDKS